MTSFNRFILSELVLICPNPPRTAETIATTWIEGCKNGLSERPSKKHKPIRRNKNVNPYFDITHALARIVVKIPRTTRTTRTPLQLLAFRVRLSRTNLGQLGQIRRDTMKKVLIYEKEKERIIEKPMDSASYEKEIRKLAKKLKI